MNDIDDILKLKWKQDNIKDYELYNKNNLSADFKDIDKNIMELHEIIQEFKDQGSANYIQFED